MKAKKKKLSTQLKVYKQIRKPSIPVNKILSNKKPVKRIKRINPIDID